MRKRKVMKLASRGKRFGAACIDAVIPAVSCIVITIATVIEAIREYAFRQNFGYGFGAPELGFEYGYSWPVSGGMIAAIVIAIILILAYIIIQLIFFNKSTSIGKAALGLQVVSARDGEPIGFWKMLFREVLVKKASEYILLLGYIWILIDDKNRGWHDKILDTYVVDLKESAALGSSSKVKNIPSEEIPVRPAPKSQPIPEPVDSAEMIEEQSFSEVTDEPIAAVSDTDTDLRESDVADINVPAEEEITIREDEQE